MAKREHIKIVKQGPKAIRAWRQAHPAVKLDLVKAKLFQADLRGANLIGAVLDRTNLIRAELAQANLFEAGLFQANLLQAKLLQADLSECTCGATVFGNVDLSDVKGLESVQHVGPSTIGVDTLFKSAGKIPVAFLRGAGVPENLVEYVGSLTGKALEFYTCFISFTDADDVFSRRLYNDLQAAGVRCWRWKEDAKWGRTLMGEVDTAIRLYDKLVVILSEASLKAEPMIREMERALQKEQHEGREVLFPIRLDDTVFSWQHALQADVVRKVIGDFRMAKSDEVRCSAQAVDPRSASRRSGGVGATARPSLQRSTWGRKGWGGRHFM